jgi:hypothetical protein
VRLGRSELLPARPVFVDSRGEWTLRYTAPAEGLAAGAAVKLVLFGRARWSMLQCDNPMAQEASGIDDDSLLNAEGKPIAEFALRPCTYVGAKAHVPFELAVENTMMTREACVRLPVGLPAAGTVEFVLGDQRGGGAGCRTPRISGVVAFDVWVDVDGTRSFEKLRDSPRLEVRAGPPARLKVIAPSCVRAGDEFDVHVVVLDEIGNPCEDFEAPASVGGSEVSLSAGQAHAQTRLEAGVHWLMALAGGLSGRSNPVKATVEAPERPIRWGDPHGHSFLCDGLESPDYFFAYARDVEHLDFTALTGHDDCMLERRHWRLPQSPYWRNPEDAWAITKYVVNSHHDPEGFCVLLAFEWTGCDEFTPTGQPRFGDRNVYFPGDDAPIFGKVDERYDSPAKLWAAVRRHGGLVIPHHPGYARHDSPLFGVDWDYHDDDAQPLVEIYSKHGASEYYGNPRPLLLPGPEGTVQAALARGHKLGFVGGSDTHASRPGSDIQEDNAVLRYSQAGLTAVRSPSLKRADLFESLRARECYATTGERIWLDFRVNERPMGCSEIEVGVGETVRVTAEVHGTDRLAHVELVRNNDVIHVESPDGLSTSLEIVDETAPAQAYYYLRVTQANGSQAWASPVWVRCA